MLEPDPQPLRVALAQMNPHVGDLKRNTRKIIEMITQAREEGAEIVLFGELPVTGYPPEDLLLKEHFLADSRAALDEIAKATPDILALVGFPERTHDVYNSLALIYGGEIKAVYRKMSLPNYGVFDERRYFQSGPGGAIIDFGDARLGITVCEDIWTPGPPASDEALAGATVIFNASASPYHAGKGLERERMLIQRARDNVSAIVFCNLVGGQDELVFDGHSVIVDHTGVVTARAPQFEEALVIGTVDAQAPRTARLRDTRLRPPVRRILPEVTQFPAIKRPKRAEVTRTQEPVAQLLDHEAEVYGALVLGVRDYAKKNGFQHVAFGLSGGIDSALVAMVTVDALGKDFSTAVIMPSPYSSDETQSDARQIADNLGIERIELPIASLMQEYDSVLADTFKGRPGDLTEENLQARIRGNLLMALSNKFGWLVLTTGNKTEFAVGYSTLYGDSAGGFAVIKDVPKTLVYRLVQYRNAVADKSLIPQSVIDRAPSAELRHDQRDADSLPDYDTLDLILEAYVGADASREQLERNGLPREAIDATIARVDRNEYKRRQAPPGIKITLRAFGRDRRIPITNGYED